MEETKIDKDWKEAFRIRYRKFYYKEDLERHINWIEEFVVAPYLLEIERLKQAANVRITGNDHGGVTVQL